MSAELPKLFYGDPSNCIDQLRRMRQKYLQIRKMKSLRIQALVKQAKKGKK
jgi:hypothetical protein